MKMKVVMGRWGWTRIGGSDKNGRLINDMSKLVGGVRAEQKKQIRIGQLGVTS